jgi:hypothetical protein
MPPLLPPLPLLLLLLLLLALGSLASGQRQPAQQRQQVSVVFSYSLADDDRVASKRTAAANPTPLRLYWRSPDGREKPFGQPMLPRSPEQRISSFVGDVWLVKEANADALLLHTIVLPLPAAVSEQLTVDMASGEISGSAGAAATGAATAAGGSSKKSKAYTGDWAVEVDLGEDYGFEFSAAKVAAERRVTLTRVGAALEEDDAFDNRHAADAVDAANAAPPEAAYGVELSESAIVLSIAPAGMRAEEENRCTVGSRVVAIDGISVEEKEKEVSIPSTKTQEAGGGTGASSARDRVRQQLQHVRLPAGESVWTIVLPPDQVSPERAKGQPLDNPYVPPRSRPAIKPVGGVHILPRGLGSWEKWEADNPHYPARLYSTDPIVRTYDEFFTPEQCAEVQLTAAPSMKRGVLATCVVLFLAYHLPT